MSEITRALATRNNTADRDLDASTEYARRIAVSELLPEAYRGKPQNVLVAAEYGRSIGVDPITAMQMVHIIKGKPTASAQLVGALVRRAGHRLRVSWDGTTAVAEIVRSDDDTFTFRSEWTRERAQAAGLTNNPTYKTHLPAMLKARAVTEVSRDACPEALAGIAYTADEVDGPVEVVAAQVATPEIALLPDGTAIEGTAFDPESGELFDAELVDES